LINVASYFDIISDLVVKSNQAIKTVLFDDKKIESKKGSFNDYNQPLTNMRCAFRTVTVYGFEKPEIMPKPVFA
jgi:hypothetical protein